MNVITVILDFIGSNWQWIAPVLAFLWEIIFRVKPTEKDWTLINAVVRILNLIFPNKAINGSAKGKYLFTVTKVDDKGQTVPKNDI